jgi:uncharacterized glyoxalase superfamily protein PhnB
MPAKPKRTKRAKPRKRVRAPQRAARRKPESLRLRAMSASLTVGDLERSLAWYRDVLGFTVGERWEEAGRLRGVQMKAGHCDVLLNQDDFQKGGDRAKGVGVRLWLSTAQDVDAVAERARAEGAVLDQPPAETSWGAYVFAITDPDGYRLTIVREG